MRIRISLACFKSVFISAVLPCPQVLAANESSGDAAEPTLGNAAGGATADLPAGTLERSASVKREREGEEEKEEGGYKLRRTGSSSQLARSTSVGGEGSPLCHCDGFL
jgi:hypothetical protein